ncbi:MAG: NnrS family protein [Rudaea sp.]
MTPDGTRHLPLAPLWASAFRPFCALGAVYGVVLMSGWVAAHAGLVRLPYGDLSPAMWHAHEMLFGFAFAIICATVLTALPGWAQTPEIRGGALAALVGLWLAGRAAFWLRNQLPPPVVLAVSVSLVTALIVVLAPQLLRVANRHYLSLLAVLAGMLVGEVLFLRGLVGAGFAVALYAVMVVYVLKAGVLTPVFTGNELRALGRGDQAPFVLPLEYAAIAALVALAALDVGGAPSRWRGLVALAAFALHAVRLARWRGWKVLDRPLVASMHAGYAWFVVALLLHALGDFGSAGAARAWLHAFTVGALGSMMLALMTRIALRHTGRPLALPPAIVASYALLQVAALLRVAGGALGLGEAWLAIAGVAWIFAFAIYLVLFGRILVSPSLPRVAVRPLGGDVR